MAQKGFDTLISVTSLRYLLSRVVGRRAAQLERGVPSTATGKVVPRGHNAVGAAIDEFERGSGVVWGKDVSSDVDIKRAVEADEQARREDARFFSTARKSRSRKVPDRVGKGASRPAHGDAGKMTTSTLHSPFVDCSPFDPMTGRVAS